MSLSTQEAATFERAGHKLHTCKDCNGAGALYGSYLSRVRLNCAECHGEGVLFSCLAADCTAIVQRYDLNPLEYADGGICDACAAEAKGLGMAREAYVAWTRLQNVERAA